MGILDVVNMDVPDLEAAPEGEYKVEIVNVVDKLDKNQRPGYNVTLKIVDRQNTLRIMHRLSMPIEGDDEDTGNSKARLVKAFASAFNIKKDDTTEWIGLTADALLTIENTPQYGDQNRVRRFVVPK